VRNARALSFSCSPSLSLPFRVSRSDAKIAIKTTTTQQRRKRWQPCCRCTSNTQPPTVFTEIKYKRKQENPNSCFFLDKDGFSTLLPCPSATPAHSPSPSPSFFSLRSCFGDFWPCTRFPLPIPFAHHQQHRSIVFVYFARITALQSEFVGKQLHIHTATVVTRKH